MEGKILIKCQNKSQAIRLILFLSTLGVKTGLPKDNEESIINTWKIHRKNTVYCIENNTLGYADIDYFRNNSKYYRYKLCKAEEFINKYKKNKTMTKEDLKPGMVIEYRTKTRRLLVPDCNNNLIAIGKYGCLENLNFYNEDLYYINNSDLDIMKVYSIKYPEVLPYILKDDEYLTLLWERKETKEYTMQEIADKLGIPVEELRIKK